MNIDTAIADELYRLLLDVQDRLGYLIEDDLLTLARDAEQAHGTERRRRGRASSGRSTAGAGGAGNQGPWLIGVWMGAAEVPEPRIVATARPRPTCSTWRCFVCG